MTYEFKDAEGKAAASDHSDSSRGRSNSPCHQYYWRQSSKTPNRPPYTEAGATSVDAIDGPVRVYSSVIDANYLVHKGFHTNSNALLNLDGNGGLILENARGQTRLTDGPTGRGLYFNGDLEFREAGNGYHVETGS